MTRFLDLARRLHFALLRFPLRFKVGGVAGILTLGLGSSLGVGNGRVFIVGETSDGHHGFEANCRSCHEPLRGTPNRTCLACHAAALREDVHPATMFDDPRWAATREHLDVLACTTCHREHQRAPGGVTVRAGFCFSCHEDVPQKHASHRSLPADSCARSGCHNYHDNSVLNVAFLTKRMGEPDLRPQPDVLERAPGGAARSVGGGSDHPAEWHASADLVESWRRSAHARGEVGCDGCHQEKGGAWVRAPGEAACEGCHRFEDESFRSGKHGVRRAAGLGRLEPGQARLPMRAQGPERPARLGCGTCHDPHAADTLRAAMEACLRCHDDEHSRSFAFSAHGRAFLSSSREQPGRPPAARDVTCATCHMPRLEVDGPHGKRVAVLHSNTLTLRPRNRMLTTVCLDCHGLPFAFSSLFDDSLVARNFTGRTARAHDTLAMVEAHARGSSSQNGR